MRFLPSVLCMVAILASVSFAQMEPAPKVADVQLMKDSSTKELVKMDFSLPLTGVSDPGILFSHFAKRPLMIYYFSPKCPHCQKHITEVQDIMKEFEPKGLAGIAIGLGNFIKKNDIRMFIDQFHVIVPVFQDANMKFGPLYGTGYIPVLYLVLPDGTFYRYETLDEANMNHLRATLNTMFTK